MTQQLHHITREMQDLCHEIDSLQERALARIETIENEFGFLNGAALPDEMRERFKRLQRLVTQV